MQSVFRTFFRRATDGHYQVPDGEVLGKLFFVIGLHKIREAAAFHRAEKRDVWTTQSLSSDDRVFAAKAPDKMAESTLQIVIDELLLNLNSSQKEIIMLRLEGMTVDAIAESTHRSRRTVERTLQKFRELLQQQLKA